MIIATVKKLDGTRLDHGKFASEEAANNWFQSFIDKGVYGQKHVPAYQEQRLISPEVRDEQGNITQASIYETIDHPEIPAAFIIEFAPDIPSEEELKQAKIEAGRAAREVCEKVLDLIAGYNLSRNLTIEQITQMQALLSNPEAALRASRPSLAKSLISAITPDEVLVTAQMKADALELLANY
jgi:hypothetical protein